MSFPVSVLRSYSNLRRTLFRLPLCLPQEPKNILPIIMNFSAQTNALRTQLTIEKKLQKKTKTLYGGPVGKKVLVLYTG